MQIGNVKLSTPIALGGGLLIFCSVCCVGSLAFTAFTEATRPPESKTATAVALVVTNGQATMRAGQPGQSAPTPTPRPAGAAAATPVPTTPPAPIIGTKDNPVPVGGEYVYTSRRDNGNTYSLVVTGVTRGAAANGVVNAANQFNTKPAAGCASTP